MQALPALKEQELNTFGQAIAALQAYTGDYFMPVQGGRYSSQSVAEVLNDLTENNITCVGQSSWGPTGFAVFESEAQAQAHLARLKSTFTNPSLDWLLCEANHTGAQVGLGTDS